MTNVRDQKNSEPAIRFKEYTDAWEQRKIGEFLTESKIPGTNGLTAKKLTVKLWGKGVIQKSEIYRGSESTNYYVRKSGQFMYGKLDFLHQAFGIVPKYLDGYESTLDSPAFDISKQINTHFFLEYISRKRFFEYQGMIANGSRKAKRIHADTFFAMPIMVPQKDEQDKIGSLFQQLDHSITLHQRKCENLQNLKKALLQRMFVSGTDTIPNIRFKGYTDAWEQRKLGELFSERSERSGVGEMISVTINSGVVKAEELDRKDNSSRDKSKYKVVKVGDIAYNSMRMWQGASGVSPYEGILSPAYTVLVPNESVNSFFFAYDFKRYKMIQIFKRNSQGLTSDTWNLKYPALSSIKTLVPSKGEQTLISELFQQLDHSITLHQRKLETLKELKKALLQKMFV